MLTQQMLFEELMDRPPDAGPGALRQIPPESRDRLLEVFADLMARAVAPERRAAVTEAGPGAASVPAEDTDHE